MPPTGPRLVIGLLLAVLLSGCQWLGRQGPVSPSLATCRQLSQQGVAALEQDRPAEAKALLAGAVEACPIDPEARRYYGEALWCNGARAEAIAQLQEACRLAGDDATLRVRLAELHLLAGHVDEARQHAQHALDLSPKLPAAWAARGRVLRAGGQPQEALADFHRALGYAPDDRAILWEIAELYRQLQRPERALATLHSLADTYTPGEEPQEVLYLSGLAYAALGRHEDAVGSLAAAAVRGTPTPEILCRLAEAELLAGHPAAAAAAARHALSLDPGYGRSLQLLDHLEVARQPQAPPLR